MKQDFRGLQIPLRNIFHQERNKDGYILSVYLTIMSLCNEHLVGLVCLGTHCGNDGWIPPYPSFLPFVQRGAGPIPPRTFGRLKAAACSHGALLPQGRHQVLQLLQSAQELLDVRSSSAPTGPAGDVDAVGEDDLVFPVQRVLLEAFPGL